MIEDSTYALLNNNNVVVNVISISPNDEKSKGLSKLFFWRSAEQNGVLFCQRLIGDVERKTKWKKGYQPYSSLNRKRVHYPAKGYKYDERNDVFIPPQPFSSWSLNTKTWDWDPPIPTPKTPHFWNEEHQKWIPII